MRRAKYEGEIVSGAEQEPLLISMEELGQIIRAGKTTCFKLVVSGQIESVHVGRRRMPVYESVKAFVTRLREQAKAESVAA